MVESVSDMETLTSSEAAERLGVNIQKFHRLVSEHKLVPLLAAPGLRGAKFWRATDIDRLAAERQASAA